MALSVIWPGQVHPRNCWFPIAVQWAAIVEIFQDDQSSDLAWWLAGVHNLVKDDIKSIYRKMRAHVNWELLKNGYYLQSWRHESQPFIHAWGGEKAKAICPSSILRFHWPSGMISGVAQFFEIMSLMRTTKQTESSHGIPSRGKAVKPIGGVANDCRTLTIMKALMMPHFRHII